jgi:hypothetical protein
MRIVGSTEAAQPSHPGVITLADTLFNPALSSGDFRMNLSGVRDEVLIRIIAAWSCSPCVTFILVIFYTDACNAKMCVLRECSLSILHS